MTEIDDGSFGALLKKDEKRFEVKGKNNHGTFVGTPLYVSPEMLEFN